MFESNLGLFKVGDSCSGHLKWSNLHWYNVPGLIIAWVQVCWDKQLWLLEDSWGLWSLIRALFQCYNLTYTMLLLTLSERDFAMHWIKIPFLWWWCQFYPHGGMQFWCPRNLDDRFRSRENRQVCKCRLEGGAKIAMIIATRWHGINGIIFI